jgi:hypothetical protein
MNNFHYHQDPMYAAATAILTGKTQLQESDTLDEAIDWNLIQSMYVKDIIDIVAALVIGGGIGVAAIFGGAIKRYLSDKADERDAKESAQFLKSTLDKILKDSKSKELISQIKSFPYSSKSTEEAKKNNEERKKLVRAYSARLKTLLSDDEYALINDIYNNTIRESADTLEEGVEDVKSIVDTLKVGDTTNFGKVLEIGTNSITFKAKDLPKTTIAFNQRKMGSSEFLLLKTIKLKEETELEEKDVAEAYKPLRKPADLIDELQSIVDAPDSKLWDVTSVSIRLSHEDIFDRFPKIYDYVEDMWFEIMQPNGAKKTKEIAKKAIEAVRKYYPDLNKSQKSNPVYKEEESIEEKTIDEAINWLGDYLPTSEKSQFGGYRPTIIDKKTKRVIYQSAVRYNAPQEAKDHAEEYLKQKSKGIKEPKLPHVGTYKEESDCPDEKMDEAADAALKRRKQVDMARVNAGTMSRDDYNKKYKLGKYRPAGSKLSGPGGVYKNLVKEEETLEEAVPTPAVQKLITSIDMLSPKDYLVFLQALADNAQGIANMSQAGKDGKSNANAWKTVADHISTAADAYAKRPVRLENIEVEGESLEEAAKITPVKGKYIFFIQDRELYQLDPYKLLAKTDFDRISSSKLMSHMKLGSEWKAVSVAWGTDLLEIGALESPKDISDAEQWYVVPHLYDKVTHLALIH